MLVQMPLWGVIVLAGFATIGIITVGAVIYTLSKEKRK